MIQNFLIRAKVAATVREFEGIIDFLPASMVAFIDLPFMFLGIIYMIAGPLAIVPILIVPIVLGVATTQPLLKRFSQRHLTAAGKTTIS